MIRTVESGRAELLTELAVVCDTQPFVEEPVDYFLDV
jgi:hypothetical protein